MTAEDAERWIVNLIRNARLDAKIDSQQGHVVMATQTVSPYQQLIEKTKMLSVRSQKLAADIEKKLNVRNAEVKACLFSCAEMVALTDPSCPLTGFAVGK